VQRGDRTMRGLERRETEKIFEQLDALGWVNRVPGPRAGDPPRWDVNREVHRLFAQRAEREASRRLSVREAIAELTRREDGRKDAPDSGAFRYGSGADGPI
jgi:hypothetical protein